MDQHLGIPLDPLIKLIICHFSVVDSNLVADHERRFRSAGDDQVSQVPVVLLDIALARCQRETLCQC